MMMVLGRYYFGLETAAFQSMARKTNYQWSASQGLPHSQLAQFIGQDVDTMRLQGVIYPHYKGGLTQTLRAMEGPNGPMASSPR